MSKKIWILSLHVSGADTIFGKNIKTILYFPIQIFGRTLFWQESFRFNSLFTVYVSWICISTYITLSEKLVVELAMQMGEQYPCVPLNTPYIPPSLEICQVPLRAQSPPPPIYPLSLSPDRQFDIPPRGLLGEHRDCSHILAHSSLWCTAMSEHQFSNEQAEREVLKKIKFFILALTCSLGALILPIFCIVLIIWLTKHNIGIANSQNF